MTAVLEFTIVNFIVKLLVKLVILNESCFVLPTLICPPFTCHGFEPLVTNATVFLKRTLKIVNMINRYTKVFSTVYQFTKVNIIQ